MTMKLKPFDLYAALRGDLIVMRDGTKVISVYHIKEFDHSLRKVLLYVYDKDKSMDYGWCHINGRQQEDGEGEFIHDLFMAPKTKTYWINVFVHRDKVQITSSGTYESEDIARLVAKDINPVWNYLKTISFEIEE